MKLSREAHNLKVVGSNPTPATNDINDLAALWGGFFAFLLHISCTRCATCCMTVRFFSPEGLEGRFKFFHCNFMQDVLEDFQRRFEAQIAGA